MVKIETHGLLQHAVYWPQAGFDKDGDPTWGDPVEIHVRWERSKRESLDADSSANAIATVVMVDREIEIGSRVWLGELADLPSPLTNAFIVIDNETIPDLKVRNYQRTITVKRLA